MNVCSSSWYIFMFMQFFSHETLFFLCLMFLQHRQQHILFIAYFHDVCIYAFFMVVVVVWFAIFTSLLFAWWNIIKFAICLLHCMVLESWLFPQVYRDNFSMITLTFLCKCISEIYLIFFFLVKLIYKTTHQLWGKFCYVFLCFY